MARRSPSRLPVIPFCVLALVALTALPTRFSGWVRWLQGPFLAIISPISHSASNISGWARRDESAPDPSEAQSIEALMGERDAYARLWRREQQENEQLRELIADLQAGRAYPERVPVDRLAADRVGRGLRAGTIDINRGGRDGVQREAVVVSRRGEQLIGLVTGVGELISTVHLITDKDLDPNLIVGVVIDDEGPTGAPMAVLPRCQLRPVGDGLLADAEFGVSEDSTVSEGDIVRLNDDTWPAAAQMLVLGRVVAVEVTDRPLFRRLVVRPMVDVSRQRSVVVHVPKAGASEVDPEAPEG